MYHFIIGIQLHGGLRGGGMGYKCFVGGMEFLRKGVYQNMIYIYISPTNVKRNIKILFLL